MHNKPSPGSRWQYRFNIVWLVAYREVPPCLLNLSSPVTAILLSAPAISELAIFYTTQQLRATNNIRSPLRHFENEVSALFHRSKKNGTSISPEDKPGGRATYLSLHWIDIAVVALIWIIIYVPRTDLLAGMDFHLQSFHHWDFFAIGPAIGLLKGKALATQVYSQYGIGWPLLADEAEPTEYLLLSYGHTFKIAVIYACVYYCGVYWLLR